MIRCNGFQSIPIGNQDNANSFTPFGEHWRWFAIRNSKNDKLLIESFKAKEG